MDKIDNSYVVTYLGLLRGTNGDPYGLGVAPNSSIVQGSGVADVTMNAVGGTFTLAAGGPANAAGALRTWSLGHNATDAAIAAALTTYRQRRCHLDDVRNRANAPCHGPRDPHADDRRPQPRQPAARRQPPRAASTTTACLHRPAEHRPRHRRRRLQRPGTRRSRRLRAERRRPLLRLVAGHREPASAVTTDFLEGNLDAVLGNLNLTRAPAGTSSSSATRRRRRRRHGCPPA